MSDTEQPDSSAPAVTAENIQRLEAGYFDHMQSLRDQIPVSEYMVDEQTNLWALLAMVGLTVGLGILFPVTMFFGFTYIVIILYLAAFIVVGYYFYHRIMIPNEETESWSDQ